MKKFIAVMLIAIVAVSGAFAAFGAKNGPEMMVGGKTGWGMDMTFTKVGDKTVTTKMHSIPVEATFTVDFTEIPVYATVDLGTEVKIADAEGADAYAEFVINAGAGYRYDVNSELAVKAGLAFAYDLYSRTDGEGTFKTTTTLSCIGLNLDLDVNYDITENVVLIGGFDLGGVLGQFGTVKNQHASVKWDGETPTNLSFAINVGAAYRF